MEKYNLFTGSKIRLTALDEDDAEKLALWSQNAEYLRNLDTEHAIPRNKEFYKAQIQSFSEDSNIVEFGIRTSEDNNLIGFISLHTIEWNNQTASLAIGIGDIPYQGKGYGSEAVQLVLKYAFNELNLNRVGLDVIGNNEKAISCYKKCGFVVEGTVREAVLRDGKKYSRIYMGILREEWSIYDKQF